MTAAELSSSAARTAFGLRNDRPAAQRVEWPDPVAHRDALAELESYPPLVFSGESDQLRSRLARVADGQALVLQGGDCAERFDQVSAHHVRGKIHVLMQMALVLSYASSLPVVKLGRIAGQYAKPRSKPVETRDGVTLPAYRGDAVNGMEFSGAARTPDPSRLKRAYHSSAATLNLVRAYVASADADLGRIHERNRLFAHRADNPPEYGRLLHEMEAALAFMRTFHGDDARTSEFFTSHEALLLDYERAMTRIDPTTDRYFDASAHMVWIGERTRRIDGAHVLFASRISNPVGVKLGPATTADDALALVDRLDPDRVPGRLTFVTRMGASRVREVLPDLVTKVAASGAQVVWVCDPMHGNTFTSNGHKTRHVEDVVEEIAGFFEVHRAAGTHPGGIHLELTGDDVTECLGSGVSRDTLGTRYESACDPRLSRDQAMDLAFRLAELIRDR